MRLQTLMNRVRYGLSENAHGRLIINRPVVVARCFNKLKDVIHIDNIAVLVPLTWCYLQNFAKLFIGKFIPKILSAILI